MITTIVIISYILSVFLARRFNYLAYKNNKDWGIEFKSWFIPIVNVIFCLLIWLISLYEEYSFFDSKSNWFTGKNWKR